MDHGREVARPTTVESTNLVMAGAVQGGEAHMSASTFHAQLGAATARRASFEPIIAAAYRNSAEFVRHVRAASGDGEVLGDLFGVPDGAGHGEVFVGLLSGGVDAAYDNYGYYALQPRPGVGHGEVFVDLLPDGAGHGEAFVGLLPGGVDAVHDIYGYYALQPRPGAGHDEVLVDLLHDGVGALFVDSGNIPQLTDRGTECADGGVVRGRSLGAGYDGSGDLAGAASNNLGMVGGYLRRLLAFIGIGACSAAVNRLAAGPGSPAVAFDQFVLLLGGLFLVILHVLRVLPRPMMSGLKLAKHLVIM